MAFPSNFLFLVAHHRRYAVDRATIESGRVVYDARRSASSQPRDRRQAE
jgi:hypothetical protein